MAKPITLKINVTRIDKNLLYKGKSGTYLDIVLFENKNGVGQFGDTHFATQSVSKEQRLAGVKGPIIGNATVSEQEVVRRYDRDEDVDTTDYSTKGVGNFDEVPF